MNYNEYMANIKAYRNGTLMQAAPTDALSDWHEKYFDTAVSALSKKMIADHVEHSEDADKFGKDFVSLVAILEEDGVSKQDIGKELEAVSKAAQSQADAAIKKLDIVQHSTDTFEGYQAAIKAYKETHLEHAEWKKHKYIRIENGRYIYPDDLKKTNNTSSRNNQVPLNKQISNKITSTLSNLTPKKTTTAPTSPASRDQISGEKYVKNKLNEIATGFKNIAKSVQDYRSEAEAKKAAADAMKAGRTATQQYKESGQYEKDVADEKAKKEQQARQDEAKKITSLTPDEARKRAAELTKQNTPESKSKVLENDILKFAKKGSSTYDKAMEKVNEILSKNPNAEVEVSLGEKNWDGIDMSNYLHLYEKSPNKDGSGKGTYIPLKDDAKSEAPTNESPKQEELEKPVGVNRDVSVDAQEKAKKEAERKKTGYSESNEALAKKYNLSDEQIDNALQMAKHRKDVAEHDLSLEAHKRANDINGNIQETESAWFIGDRKGNLIATYEKSASLEDYVKNEIESENKVNSYEKEYEKYGLTREQLKSAIKEAENSYDKKLSSYGNSAYSRANRTGGNVTKHPSGNGWRVVDNNGNVIAEYPIESLNQFIDKACKELIAKKKVQHSDPREAFYAAIDAYKAQHGTPRVPL